MKILLLSANYNFNDLSVGLNSIHAALLAEQHQSHFVTIPTHQNTAAIIPALADFIRQMQPQVIGCSLYTNEFPQMRRLTGAIRTRFPAVPIVWGGVHPTMDPESCFPYADYVCVGEGEQTMLEIAKRVDAGESFRSTRNLCHIKDGALFRNTLYPAIADLDAFPFPGLLPPNTYVYSRGAIQPLDTRRYARFATYRGRVLHALSSRGCPFECTYCCNSFYLDLYGKRVRSRSVDNLIASIRREITTHRDIEFVFFYDENFLAHDTRYLSEFCHSYRRHVGKPFTIMSNPLYIDDQKVSMLKDAGLMFVQAGLQTGSDRVAKTVFRRKSLRGDFLRAMHVLKDQSVPASVDVILDNPFEGETDLLRTILTLARTPKPFNAIFFSLTFFRGTRIAEIARAETHIDPGHPTEKNTLACRPTGLNEIAKLAVYLSPRQVRRLVASHRRYGAHRRFWWYMRSMKLLSCALYRPYWDLRLLYTVSNRSVRRMLVNMRFLLGEWFRRRFIWNMS